MKYLIVYICGVISAIGIGYSQLVRPQKFLGFLNISPNWDPTVLISFGTAVVVFMLVYFFFLHKQTRERLTAATCGNPIFDRNLFLGEAIMGLGIGIGGMCPATAVLGLITMHAEVILFAIGLVLSMQLLKWYRTSMTDKPNY